MSIQLTKNADLIICTAYKMYLDRKSEGATQVNAVVFDDDKVATEIQRLTARDVTITKQDLIEYGMVEAYIRGFKLTQHGIQRMEARFNNDADSVSDCIEQLKKASPEV